MVAPNNSKKFVIIDGKSVFYRGYYAMPNLSTNAGVSTGGVFGFATMALEVIRKLKPDYVAVAWDKPKTNIRKRLSLYPEYKAGRKPAPADFYEQVPLLHKLLEAFGWPLYELDDYEADDIMCTLAVQASKKDIDTLLVTSDLDLLQMIDSRIHVYALKTGLSNIELYSPKSFEAKYGIDVNQFLDLKAIKGDSSDNIPGVPGIGEKGAVDLLKQFKTLDGIYDNLDLIKENLRKKLVEGKQLAYLSKQLAKIWTDAPIKLDLNEVDGSKLNPEEVVSILNELQFRSLTRNLPPVIQDKLSEHIPQTKLEPSSTLIHINKDSDLDKLNLSGNNIICTSHIGGSNGNGLNVLGLCDEKNNLYIINAAKIHTQQLGQALKDNLSTKKLTGYDVKPALKVLLSLGLPEVEVEHDLLIGAFAINPLNKISSLFDLARSELSYGGSDFNSTDPDNFILNLPIVVELIKQIYDLQKKDLEKLGKVKSLLKDIEWPIIPVLAKMEFLGIEMDVDYLLKFSKKIDALIKDYEKLIYKAAGSEFNISSPQQLSDILFNKLNLSTQDIKKGKNGYSTAATALDRLRGAHPIIDLISQYREVTKLKNTYVDTLPKQVDDNSRIHTTFNLTIAQTGRLSSTDPNLQNIPIRTELGRNIRNAFIAGQGNKLVSADYSQFELRLAAVLAGDTELIEIFNRGADIHAETAALVYGREQEDVTKQMRRAAKVINFGILYGMSPHGLSVATGMTHDQAVSFINRYKELRAPLFKYMDKTIADAKTKGYVETLFGRRRPTPDIKSANYIIRSAAERAAINMPIQGTEADLMKMAMIEIDKILDDQHNNCYMLLQIHDSILVECPKEVSEQIGEQLKLTMQSIYELPVKLDVDISIGDNWGEL